MKRTFSLLLRLPRQFWFRPALMTVLAVLLAEVLIRVEEAYGVPPGLRFIYGGSPTGARTLLGAVASSMIGVAGTVFSITIAALSLASGQMGPRLLNNFTEDKGNQYTLGVFISTFAFSLYTLRAVQGGEGDSVAFVPHYGVTVSMLLAAICLGMLVYYIHHISSSINIAQVTGLLRNDMRGVLDAYTIAPGQEQAANTVTVPASSFWEGATPVYHSEQGGYLQATDLGPLLALAAKHDLCLLLEVRPGDYVFPYMRVARLRGLPAGQLPPFEVSDALTLGPQRSKEQDPEYVVRQLADIATRALSPGTNDPLTAVGVLDQFGDALCRLKGRSFPSGVRVQGGQVRLIESVTSFGGMTDQMFHMIRQYGADAPAVVVRMFEVLTRAAQVLERPDWRAELARHAALLHQDARAKIENTGDLRDIEARFREFQEAVSPLPI
ncbi:DUF2254 domain-containing protein [Deinococcus sp. UYEF24]